MECRKVNVALEPIAQVPEGLLVDQRLETFRDFRYRKPDCRAKNRQQRCRDSDQPAFLASSHAGWGCSVIDARDRAVFPGVLLTPQGKSRTGIAIPAPGPAARLRACRPFVNTESMPPVGRVIETCLHADPLDRAVEFYSRIFGFPKLVGDQRICAFSVSDQQVLILFQKGGTRDA